MNDTPHQNAVGILSMQRVVNFGSVLQAYSLRELIREQVSCPVDFVDIDAEGMLPSLKSIAESVDYETPADYPPGILQKGKRRIITWLSRINKRLIRRFMRTQLQLEHSAPRHSCVVVGSDEVFNHARGVSLQLHGQIPQADLVFSYAASCGNAIAADIYPEDRSRVAGALAHFSCISVRDEATANYVAALTGKSTVRHLDPVLVGDLFKRPHRPVPIRHYLLVYAYGQRIRTREEIREIRQFAKKHNLMTVAMGGSQFWCDLYIPTSPFRLLDYFYYADYVVTDTFHGSVFSVINHRQFAVLPRKTNTGKILGLLDDLHLSDRMADPVSSLEEVLTRQIPYRDVDEILIRERARTRQYLKEQLEFL